MPCTLAFFDVSGGEAIVLALVGMIVVLFVANVYLFKGTVDDLSKALDRIIARGATASMQAPNGEAK